MFSSKVFLLCFFFFSFLSLATNAFNITELLSSFPDYSTFSNYLAQTQVADAINRQSTVTVLVVGNGNMQMVSSLPMDTIKTLLTLHVLLDYLDTQRFNNMQNSTVQVTTLYQTTGLATGGRGQVKIMGSTNGDVTFQSAADGSTENSKFVKTILTQPYNISVLEISNLITPPGLSGGNSSSNSSATAPSPSSSSPAPTNSTPASSPATSPTAAVTPAASNTPPSPASAPSVAVSPASSSSPNASTVPTSAPTGAPPKPSADAPSLVPQANDTPANETTNAPSGHPSAAAMAAGIKSSFLALMFATAWLWVRVI
ncbi:hypothetical protein SLE2022_307220 [Rubroshorea leprosula]